MFFGIGPEDDAFPSMPLLTGFVTGQEQSLLAYWLPWHPQEYTPETATISMLVNDCTFQNPVRIDLLTGDVYAINDFESKHNQVVFNNIPLADYPFIIVELDKINLD